MTYIRSIQYIELGFLNLEFTLKPQVTRDTSCSFVHPLLSWFSGKVSVRAKTMFRSLLVKVRLEFSNTSKDASSDSEQVETYF